jgi:transcriptional regulator with XRE-family HTH domain
MKTSSSISAQLGVSQRQLAAVLGVSRSLISLFELGRRSLPPKALSQLTQMLEGVKSAPQQNKRAETELDGLMLIEVDRLISENEFRQEVNRRKIVAANRKHAHNEKVLTLASVLESSSSPKLSPVRVAKASDPLFHKNFVQLQLKQECLEAEAKFLIEKRGKLEGSKR